MCIRDRIVHLVDDSLGPVSSGTLWDLSGAGATGGATRYSTGTIAFSQDVSAVNDAPAGADKTITIDEDAPRAFTAADFGFTDSHDNHALHSVIITTLP